MAHSVECSVKWLKVTLAHNQRIFIMCHLNHSAIWLITGGKWGQRISVITQAPHWAMAASVWLPARISWGDSTYASLEALLFLLIINSVSCLLQSADIHYKISIYLFVPGEEVRNKFSSKMRKIRAFCESWWSDVQASKNINDMLRRPVVPPFRELQFL